MGLAHFLNMPTLLTIETKEHSMEPTRSFNFILVCAAFGFVAAMVFGVLS